MIYDLKHPPIFGPLWSCSIHFHPIKSIQSYQVHIGPIRFTLAVLGPLLCILSTLVLLGSFNPIRFTSVHSIHLGSICSYSVHLGPFILIRSILVIFVHFGPFGHIRSTLFLFGPLQSYSVLFGSFNHILSTLVHFSPLHCIRSFFVHLHNGKIQVWVESTNSKSNYIYIYIYIKDLKLVISKM